MKRSGKGDRFGPNKGIRLSGNEASPISNNQEGGESSDMDMRLRDQEEMDGYETLEAELSDPSDQ